MCCGKEKSKYIVGISVKNAFGDLYKDIFDSNLLLTRVIVGLGRAEEML